MYGALRKAVALLGASLIVCGCKGEEDKSPSTVSPPGATKCVQGIQRAMNAKTAKEVSAIYYGECAEMLSQPACRDAWRAAAAAPADLQLPGVADACRKAYCPTYSAFSFDICRDDFVASPDTLLKAWPPLFDAILAREAGPAQPQVSSAMLVLYARLKQLEAAAPPASETSSAPTGVPAPPGSASAGAPSNSASAGGPGATPRAPRKRNPAPAPAKPH